MKKDEKRKKEKGKKKRFKDVSSQRDSSLYLRKNSIHQDFKTTHKPKIGIYCCYPKPSKL